VDSAAFAGQPVTVVRQPQRDLGLVVLVLGQPGGRQPPGTVVSVWPRGQVPAGSLIAVTAETRPRDRRHGNGDRDD